MKCTWDGQHRRSWTTLKRKTDLRAKKGFQHWPTLTMPWASPSLIHHVGHGDWLVLGELAGASCPPCWFEEPDVKLHSDILHMQKHLCLLHHQWVLLPLTLESPSSTNALPGNWVIQEGRDPPPPPPTHLLCGVRTFGLGTCVSELPHFGLQGKDFGLFIRECHPFHPSCVTQDTTNIEENI